MLSGARSFSSCPITGQHSSERIVEEARLCCLNAGIFAATFQRLHRRGVEPGVLHPAVSIPAAAELAANKRSAAARLPVQLVTFLGTSRCLLSINRFERKKVCLPSQPGVCTWRLPMLMQPARQLVLTWDLTLQKCLELSACAWPRFICPKGALGRALKRYMPSCFPNDPMTCRTSSWRSELCMRSIMRCRRTAHASSWWQGAMMNGCWSRGATWQTSKP